MAKYILQHSHADFTGYCGHIGFENGVGSTNKESDARACVEKHKCRDITEQFKKAQAAAAAGEPKETAPPPQPKAEKPKAKRKKKPK